MLGLRLFVQLEFSASIVVSYWRVVWHGLVEEGAVYCLHLVCPQQGWEEESEEEEGEEEGCRRCIVEKEGRWISERKPSSCDSKAGSTLSRGKRGGTLT